MIKIRICIFFLAQPPARNPLGQAGGGGGGRQREGRVKGVCKGRRSLKPLLTVTRGMICGTDSSLDLCTGTGNLLGFKDN